FPRLSLTSLVPKLRLGTAFHEALLRHLAVGSVGNAKRSFGQVRSQTGVWEPGEHDLLPCHPFTRSPIHPLTLSQGDFLAAMIRPRARYRKSFVAAAVRGGTFVIEPHVLAN